MSMRSGRYKDMGDIVIHTEWLIKGRHWKIVFHTGAHRDLPVNQRPVPVTPTTQFTPERIDLIMDLGADKKVQLSVTFTDEVGNAVPTPIGATVVWAVDNTDVIALIDEDPNVSIWAAATGLLGNAIVTATVTLPNSTVVTGDLLLSVVPGEAERVAIAAGTVEEVTPDVEPTPEP